MNWPDRFPIAANQSHLRLTESRRSPNTDRNQSRLSSRVAAVDSMRVLVDDLPSARQSSRQPFGIHKGVRRSRLHDYPSGMARGCTDMGHCFGRVLAFTADHDQNKHFLSNPERSRTDHRVSRGRRSAKTEGRSPSWFPFVIASVSRLDPRIGDGFSRDCSRLPRLRQQRHARSRDVRLYV